MPDKSPPTVKVGPWPKGIDNRSPDYSVPGDAVRNAVNVNLSKGGQARRRDGYTKFYSATGAHSLWSCELGSYFIENGAVQFFSAERDLAVGSPIPTVLLAGLSGTVAFEYFDGDVYLSDAYMTWVLRGGTQPTLWGIPAPHSTLALYADDGELQPGIYLAAVSFLAADGREGPLSPLSAVETAAGGLRVASFPSSPSEHIVGIRLYLSGPGSSTLYSIADLPVGVEEYAVTERSDTGSVADLRTLVAPPPASIIKHHRGRMFLASGGVVFYTEPLALHLVDPVKNFWQFPETISIMEPVEAGMFIVADKTYFVAFTDPDDAKVAALQPDKGVPGTAQRIPTGEGVIWYGDRGVMLGTQDGRVEAVQEELVAADKARKGAALLREKDGLRQYIASLQSPEISGLTARSFMEAEIIRRGG